MNFEYQDTTKRTSYPPQTPWHEGDTFPVHVDFVAGVEPTQKTANELAQVATNQAVAIEAVAA